MKEYNREVLKAYERMGKFKTDVNSMPKPARIINYVSVAISIAAFLMMLLYGNSQLLSTIAMIITLIGVAVILGLYLYCRAQGPIKYFEVMIKHEGVRLTFQVINEKHIIFSDGSFTIEYKKGVITEIPGLMNPHLSYTAPQSCDFYEKRMTRTGATYIGETETFGKKAVYQVNIDNKLVSSVKAYGRRIYFDCVNQRDALLTVPSALADEIKARGVNLPKDVVIKD